MGDFMVRAADLIQTFQAIYGSRPRLYRAPGRVNLIGQHTDYNAGFVMPAALDLFAWIAVTPRDDRSLVMRATNYPDLHAPDLDTVNPHTPLPSALYLAT